MTRRTRLQVVPSNMMEEKLQSFVDSLTTSQEQWKGLLPSQLSEQVSMLGKGGRVSVMDTIDTLTQWYDTLSKKEKETFWILTLDFSMLLTPLGTPSRDSNF